MDATGTFYRYPNRAKPYLLGTLGASLSIQILALILLMNDRITFV
jgi:hypothetical protein